MTAGKDKRILIDRETKENWDKAMTILKGDALYPHPDWYMTQSLIADLAWDLFARDTNGTNAMLAIEAILKEKLPLPDELVPWVIKACVAWRGSDGITRELGNEETDRKWYKVFSSIYYLRMKGLTKEDATKKIAKKTGLSYDSLFATHKRKNGETFKKVKADIHRRLMGTVMVFIDEGVKFDGHVEYDDHSREFIESFVDKYPAFFKKKLYMDLFPQYEKYFQDIIDLTE